MIDAVVQRALWANYPALTGMPCGAEFVHRLATLILERYGDQAMAYAIASMSAAMANGDGSLEALWFDTINALDGLINGVRRPDPA